MSRVRWYHRAALLCFLAAMAAGIWLMAASQIIPNPRVVCYGPLGLAFCLMRTHPTVTRGVRVLVLGMGMSALIW